MAIDLLATTAFERDLRRLERQRKDIDKLEDIVNLLQAVRRQLNLPADDN
jgi:mRNA-degrading endonuclease YafQ of YafQ-DinJ toxin-antitoxin module